MAERFYGRIDIPVLFVDDKVRSLIDDYSGEQYEEDGILTMEDSEARYGEFEDLEDYLVKSQIPFDRASEAYTEYDAETVYYRPESGLTTITVTAASYKPYVLAADLYEVLDMEPVQAVSKLKELLAANDPQVPSLINYTQRLEEDI